MLQIVAKVQAALYGGGDRTIPSAVKAALMDTGVRTRLSRIVGCPYCHVAPGQKCQNADGREISGHHHARWLVVLPIWQNGIEIGVRMGREQAKREAVRV